MEKLLEDGIPGPRLFMRFFSFVDASLLDLEYTFKPNMISLVRHPVKRFVSFFNYIREPDRPWGHAIYKGFFASRGQTYRQWQEQDINECILERQIGCQVAMGMYQNRFLSVVRGSMRMCSFPLN